jgi:hypothetical protein
MAASWLIGIAAEFVRQLPKTSSKQFRNSITGKYGPAEICTNDLSSIAAFLRQFSSTFSLNGSDGM